MKITFVLPIVGLAGGSRVVAILAKMLKQRGHEVFIIAIPQPQPTFTQKVRSWLRGEGWNSQSDRQPSHFDILGVEYQLTDRDRPVTDADLPDADVVIATWWATAEWVAKLSPAKGAKAYFLQHYEVFDYLPKPRVEATWSLPLHKIPVAQWLVDIAQTQYGDSNVSLVPPSVDTQQFYAPPRGKQPIPTVGIMYSTVNWKGCDIGLQAFSIAAKKIPNLRLVSFGSGKASPDLPLPPGAEYDPNPSQKALKDLYSKCDAWLFASRSEGFGLPILEAMACRTPVIGTPVGAAPELLSSGGGILVKPEDPEDMAKAIEQVCHLSDDQWRTMSDAAYAQVTAYTWEDATDRFEAALQTAISRSPFNSH